MLTGPSVRSQISPSDNAVLKRQGPAPVQQTAQVRDAARTEDTQRNPRQLDLPVGANAKDIANARELTDASTIQQFNTVLRETDATTIDANISSLSEFVPDRGSLLGNGDASGEVLNAMGFSGAYAANTQGLLADLSVMQDPSRNVTANVGNTGNSTPTDVGGSVGMADKLQVGAVVGATFGLFTSIVGIYKSSQQLESADKKAAMAKQINAQADQLQQLAEKMAQLSAAPGNDAMRGEVQDMVTAMRDRLVNEQGRLEPNSPFADSLRDNIANLTARLGELNTVPFAWTPQLTTLGNQIKGDMVATRQLAKMVADESSSERLDGGLGMATNINSLVNAVFTGISVFTKAGDVGGSVLSQIGTGFSNLTGSILIATQAVSGAGMVLTGTIGAVRDAMSIHSSSKKIERVDNFMANRPDRAGNADAVEKQNEVKDIAKMTRAENVSNKKWKWASFFKNVLTAVAGALLVAGMIAAAVTPVGWIVGGVAAAAAIGIGLCKLYHKGVHKQTVAKLGEQRNSAQTRLDNLKPNQAAWTQLRDDLQTANTKRNLLTQRQDLLQTDQGLQSQHDQLTATLSGLVHARRDVSLPQERKRELVAQQLDISRQLSRVERELDANTQDLQANTLALNAQYPGGIPDPAAGIQALNQQINLAVPALVVVPGVPVSNADLDTKIAELTTDLGKITSLEKLVSNIDTRLRQVSPEHAINDLVRLVGENNEDALDFAMQVVKVPTPPDGLLEMIRERDAINSKALADRTPAENLRLAELTGPPQDLIANLQTPWREQAAQTDPIMLAELFRKNMNLVYG